MNKYNLGAKVHIRLEPGSSDKRESTIATIIGIMLDDEECKTVRYKVNYPPSEWDRRMGSTGTIAWIAEDSIIVD